MATTRSRGGQTPARNALQLAVSALLYVWALLLTLLIMWIGAMLGLFGAMTAWSRLRALFSFDSGVGAVWHAPVGLAMIAVGVLVVYRWTNPAVRKLSGRESPSGGFYGGGYSGGGGDCGGGGGDGGGGGGSC